MSSRRRSDTPLTILGFGIVSVVALGWAVVRYTGNTPILQLPPALELRTGVPGFVARIKRGLPPHLEIEVPPEAAPDAQRLTSLGAFAVMTYRKLAPNTQVDSAVVRVKGKPEVLPVTVTYLLALSYTQAVEGIPQMAAAVPRLADVDVQVVGLSRSGADVRVTGRADRDGDQVAADAVAAIAPFEWVGRVEVVVHGAKGDATRRGGRDVPRTPRRP